ncbi:hypothetical protein KI387_020243, partial [Taxus chinensis]
MEALEDPDKEEDTLVFEDFQEDTIVGSIVSDSLDASLFAYRLEESLLVRNMFKIIDVNLEDISIVEEDVQRAQEVYEKVLNENMDESKEVKELVKDSPFKVCSNLHVLETMPMPSPKWNQKLRTRSKEDIGANRNSPRIPFEKEKRDRVAMKDIIEGHQKPLSI